MKLEIDAPVNGKTAGCPGGDFVWMQKSWPGATVDRAALKDELDAFASAFRAAKKLFAKMRDPATVAHALAQEAVDTSGIEGVSVDESVVMSSICKVLGVAYAPKGFAKDGRAEGVARMMLSVRKDLGKPLSAPLLKRWHKALLGESDPHAGEFRAHPEPMRVIRRHADGSVEVRYVAPPSAKVACEMRRFFAMWNRRAVKPAEVALKCAMMHVHFESIHPFEDGNGRVGRALAAKTLAEGLGLEPVLPVSTVLSRHRAAYYDELNAASRTLDWTDWAAFFIPVMTEAIGDFAEAAELIAAKKAYFGRYESAFSERAKKTLLRMFDDGMKGIRSGLSASKWMRMAKVSKATATKDLAELAGIGAIIPEYGGPQTRYRLDSPLCRKPIDTINDTINNLPDRLLRLVSLHPGRRAPFFQAALAVSRATVARTAASLAAAGSIEYRGSRKTGGYHLKGTDPSGGVGVVE